MEKSVNQKCRELASAYFKSMLFAFTGGNVTLPLLQEQLDDHYHLMEKDKVLEYFALGQTLPGVISLNAGILIGRSIAGWPGAFAVAVGIITPAFCGMLLIAFSYQFITGLSFVTGAISGIRIASIAIIATNAWMIAKRAKNLTGYSMVLFAFVMTSIFKWNIVLVMLLCGVIGIFALPDKEESSAEDKKVKP